MTPHLIAALITTVFGAAAIVACITIGISTLRDLRKKQKAK